MYSTTLAVLMIFFKFATGAPAPPLSRRDVLSEVCIDDNNFMHNCPDEVRSEGFILPPTLLMTVLVVTAAIILALLAWAFHFYLSQVLPY